MNKRAVIFDLDHTIFATEQTLHDGVTDLLAILRNLGFKMAALTSNDHRTLVRLEEAGIKHYFESLLCADHEIPPKAVQGVKHVLSKMEVDPSDAVFVSHAYSDILLAQEAGLGRTIGVSHGMDNVSPLKRAGAHRVVEDIPSVLGAVE
jgi:phosphoglycolate phosphatase-like HAD superfamily hydrolase